MLRQSAKENPLKGLKPIKRRAKAENKTVTIISSSDSEDDDLEDVDLTGAANHSSPPADVNRDPDEGGDPDVSGDSDAFEDLEDVDLDATFGVSAPATNEMLTFAIKPHEEITEKKAKKFNTIPKEERHMRKLIHKLYIEAMVAHGVLRNRWCNDPGTTAGLRDLLPRLTVKLLNEPWVDGKEIVLARRFILGLLKAQEIYSKRFKVTCQGLVRKDWGDMGVEQNYIEHNVNLAKFKSRVNSLQGSRDVGAQGFVALLRSCGVHCRLVFSLQPPDFRSVLPAQSTIEKKEKEEKERKQKPRSEFDPVFIPNAKQEVLAGMRAQAAPLEPLRRNYKFPMSPYPIFWAEAWNKFSRKWITIDPMLFECVEVMPMRKKCKFEPPGTDKTHQPQYILAFDKFGRVKDVTRRYTLNYNANVIKKRIDAVSDEDEHWYLMVLRSASTTTKKFRQAEIFELKEFYDRDVSEGIPKSKKGFKNHPVYALESEIRQDEVIYPKDSTSKCGTFKSVNKSTIEPIYKRSHVYRIRTAKAWHMRGRVLKMGALPLKTKKANSVMPDEAGRDDDEEVRLYAEFQTQLYNPPPIVNGKVTKNAYGNVEIYTATMMPDNGYLIKLTEKTSMKLLERAARDVLRIDYARAIVAFDFGKKGATTPREGGILIDKEFKEAALLVVDELVEMEEEEKRKGVELNALKCWKFFLAKLRIVRRLDRQHGKITQNIVPLDDNPNESNDEGGYFSVASEGEGSSGDETYIPRKRRRFESDEEHGNLLVDEGGFIPENQEDDLNEVESGGFLLENRGEDSLYRDEGGFLVGSTHHISEDSEVGTHKNVILELGDSENSSNSREPGGFLVALDHDDEPGGFLTEDIKLESKSPDEVDLSKCSIPHPEVIVLRKDDFTGELESNHEQVHYSHTIENDTAGIFPLQSLEQQTIVENETDAEDTESLLAFGSTLEESKILPEITEVISLESSEEREGSTTTDKKIYENINTDRGSSASPEMQPERGLPFETKLEAGGEKNEDMMPELYSLVSPTTSQEESPIESSDAADSADLNPQQGDEEMFDFDYSDSE